jgi:hypothetical protein
MPGRPSNFSARTKGRSIKTEFDCKAEVERMLKNSQTKVIMPTVALGVFREYASTGQAVFTDVELRLAYESAVHALKKLLGHDVHIGAKYEDAYGMRMSRYGVLSAVGHLRYALTKPFAIHAHSLCSWIREINHLKDRLTFVEGDGFVLLEEQRADTDAVFFIDPPYTLAARRLYTKWQIDHRRLFATMRACKGDFLMTYDNTPEIAGLAAKFGFQAKPVAMKNTHHAKMTELLIGARFELVRLCLSYLNPTGVALGVISFFCPNDTSTRHGCLSPAPFGRRLPQAWKGSFSGSQTIRASERSLFTNRPPSTTSATDTNTPVPRAALQLRIETPPPLERAMAALPPSSCAGPPLKPSISMLLKSSN